MHAQHSPCTCSGERQRHLEELEAHLEQLRAYVQQRIAAVGQQVRSARCRGVDVRLEAAKQLQLQLP